VASDEPVTCVICQDTLSPEQEGRKLLACGHWFHRTCIDTWFTRNVRCPNCRHDVRWDIVNSEPEEAD
jgi:E3 ubiquitin-protein ligase RNF38/44